MKYTHIIFDMDGTLVNTSAYTIGACRQASEEQGLPVPADDAIIKGIGYTSEDFYRLLLPGLSQDSLNRYGQRVRVLEEEGLVTLGEAILFPGVLHMLRVLQAGGAALYIASTGECEYVHLALESAGIAGFFCGIFAGEPAKEAMAIGIKACAPYGIWAFVGDRFKDSDAAKAAGMPSIFAGWGFTPQEEGALFNRYANSTKELLEMLGYTDVPQR